VELNGRRHQRTLDLGLLFFASHPTPTDNSHLVKSAIINALFNPFGLWNASFPSDRACAFASPGTSRFRGVASCRPGSSEALPLARPRKN
jgi:hypothetical protein